MCLLTSEMKLKLLFCECVQKIIDLCKEGNLITSTESFIDTEALPSFLIERMDNALKTVAYKILTHNATTITDHEEILKAMEGKEDTESGLKAFLSAIEMSGLECSEIISLVESKDILDKKEEFHSMEVASSEPQSAHEIIRTMSLDTLMELSISRPRCILETLQLQPGDVVKTEVLI